MKYKRSARFTTGLCSTGSRFHTLNGRVEEKAQNHSLHTVQKQSAGVGLGKVLYLIRLIV